MDVKNYLDKVIEMNIDLVLLSNPALVIELTENLYDNIQRHKYSDIFSYLANYNIDDVEHEEDLQYLPIKLDFIYKYLKKSEHKYADNILKLYDHIELEMSRKDYFDSMTTKKYKVMNIKFESDIEHFKNTFETLNKTIEAEHVTIDHMSKEVNNITTAVSKVVDESDKVTNKINDVYVQFVTILGIFTAIVFALFGGMSSVSATVAMFANNEIGLYKTLIVMLSISAIILNLLYLFIYLIGKLIDKPVGIICKRSNDCSSCIETKLKCRIKNKHSVIYYGNLILFIIMISMVLFGNFEVITSIMLSLFSNAASVVYSIIELVSDVFK